MSDTTKAVKVPTETTYKGHPLLVLPNPEDPSRPGIAFGVRKLKAVLAHKDAVEAFIKKVTAPTPVAKVDALIERLKALGVPEDAIRAALA